MALMMLVAKEVPRNSPAFCRYGEWGFAVWDSIGGRAQEAGLLTGIRSDGPVGVNVDLVPSVLDVRRLAGPWFVFCGGVGDVGGAASFMAGPVTGRERRSGSTCVCDAGC